MPRLTILAMLALALAAASPLPPSEDGGPAAAVPAARPDPRNRGNCYQYKKCLGESIGNMPVESPEYCKPIGGKSWMNGQGRCFDFPDGPQPLNPQDFV
ncbi:MAG: hypothetical protein LBQ12_13835 [Deltaproteobacteria bacterium]|jgi:hypothetical protein|nr:hypothetical protein [Deltaproteobacteria bacterium]